MSDKNELAVEGKGGKLLFTNRYLLRLLWPLFVEQLLVYAVGLADSVMVASVGEEAVSAVSLVDSVMVLVITIFIALSTGGAVVAKGEGGKQGGRPVDIVRRVVLVPGHSRHVCVQDRSDASHLW